jgi:mRNA-degrading endonuclease YafQ of YafQ-DinJ toxin-antitoxin module
LEVSFSDSFKKSFNKRVKSTHAEQEFWFRLELFIADPFDSKLKTHKLSVQLKGLWSFSIEYDLRVVFYFSKEKPQKAIFVDIGTQDEVY